MDLIFYSDNPDISGPLQDRASANGHHVLRQLDKSAGISDFVVTMCPDAVVFVCGRIIDSLLQEITDIDRLRPTPVLMFSRDSSQNSIHAVISAGVTTCVIDCAEPDRLDSLLQVADARFKHQQHILNELNNTKKALQDRKFIEKAKGIIMRQKALSEDQAYRSMQKLAMDRNKRIGEIAEQVIAASEILV